MGEVEKRYQQLKKKYNLPSLKELVNEFGINPENPDLILHDIINKILENFLDSSKTLESIVFVNPNSLPSQLYEANMIKSKRNEVFELYKKLMSMYWEGERSVINAKEKEMAVFIREVFNDWTKKIKHELMNICELFQKEWKNAKLRGSSSLMYHG